MSELLEYLSECDEVSLANIQACVDERKREKKRHIIRKLVSVAISEKLVGPPANQVLTEEEKLQYEADMEDCMQDGTWDDLNKLKAKLSEKNVDAALVTNVESNYPE